MILAFKPGERHGFVIWAIVLCAVWSCQKDNDDYITIEGQAQGTTFHVTYRDSLSRDFSKEIDSLFRLINHSMSLWDSTSLISRINENDTSVIPDEHFRKVFIRSNQISEITDGAFDVTVGPLVRAWGFSAMGPKPIPDSSAINQIKQAVGYQKVSLENGRVSKSDPDIQLDFNGIAQGYTVDLICTFLQKQGIRHFLVEIGGEVRAQGENDRGMVWQVGIDKPIDTLTTGRPLQTIISLQGKALATSGSYRHYLENKGKKLSHVIDPATGYPVSHSLVSVSVLANDCMTADALATAFLVMGVEKAIPLARELGIEIYCIYKDQTGDFQVMATEGFLD